MKILQVGTLDIKYGGPALSTYLTIKGLQNNGVETRMLMASLKNPSDIIAEDVDTIFTSPVKEARSGFIPGLSKTLDTLPECDLIHVQGLWLYLNHKLSSYARKKNIPYMITLRGMLYPQALQYSKYIKKVSLALYQKKDLQNAACVQATCVEELRHYRDMGFTNPVAVLPNPIETEGIIDIPNPPCEKTRIGYLGRVHPRKRIERLIYAFAELGEITGDAELVIIGADDPQYEEFLKAEVERLKLTNVRFTGFLAGKEKDSMIRSLSYLAVPSDFENFGNIVTEALVRGIPVIASKGMPWKELETHDCGWWINNDQETVTKTIRAALGTSEERRRQMGFNGKQLIRDNYSVDVLGQKMLATYHWMLNGGEKPSFIYG